MNLPPLVITKASTRGRTETAYPSLLHLAGTTESRYRFAGGYEIVDEFNVAAALEQARRTLAERTLRPREPDDLWMPIPERGTPEWLLWSDTPVARSWHRTALRLPEPERSALLKQLGFDSVAELDEFYEVSMAARERNP